MRDIWKPAAVLLGVALMLLGLIVLIRPAALAPLFGMPVIPQGAQILAGAIGLRDVAFGLAILGSIRRSVAAARAFLQAALIVPAGDLALVAIATGFQPSLAFLPHGLSALYIAALVVSARTG